MQIGEVAREVGVATSAIRFYEEVGLLPEPARSDAGYRIYERSTVDRLAFIRAGQGVGLTLDDLRQVLQVRDSGDPPCAHVSALIERRIDETDERIRDLKRLRRELVAVGATAAQFDPEDCSPEGVCQILNRVGSEASD